MVSLNSHNSALYALRSTLYAHHSKLTDGAKAYPDVKVFSIDNVLLDYFKESPVN